MGTTMALGAADVLAGEGIEAEVVDLRVLSPLDVETIGLSARRTGRVICVSDDPLLGGFSATLATAVQEAAWGELRAPVLRLGSKHVPAPYAKNLEERVYPS